MSVWYCTVECLYLQQHKEIQKLLSQMYEDVLWVSQNV